MLILLQQLRKLNKALHSSPIFGTPCGRKKEKGFSTEVVLYFFSVHLSVFLSFINLYLVMWFYFFYVHACLAYVVRLVNVILVNKAH